EQSNARRQPKKEPREGLRRAVDEPDERQRAQHPEDGREGIHREKAVDADVNRNDAAAAPRQRLRGAAAAESPCKQAGKKNSGRSGECRENANRKQRVAEEYLAQPCLQGDDGAVVNEAPGKMMAAGDVVELVAEIAVTDVLGPER